MRYRKKAVVVDAIRYMKDNADEVFEFLEDYGYYDDNSQHIMTAPKRSGDCAIDIISHLGDTILEVGDWAVRDKKGDFFSVQNSVFLEEYELVKNRKRN